MAGKSITDTAESAFQAPHLNRDRIRAALHATQPAAAAASSYLRPAAVLVPVVERDEPTLLFTRRTDHLPTHAGQVSFPGGRLHAEDASLTAAALRETWEEIGIPADAIEIAGFLDIFETLNSGFTILPVVGFLRPDTPLNVNHEEVAEVFEVPLSFVTDPRNHVLKQAMRGGEMRQFHAITFNGYTIWGATAAMIVDFSQRLNR